MVKVTEMLVSKSVQNKVTYGGKNIKRYLVYHETANRSKGANAKMHAILQRNGNSRQASWQYTIDDKGVYQSFPDDAQCWHASKAAYNRASIGFEICVDKGGDYKKAVQNAAIFMRSKQKEYEIPMKNTLQHFTTSGGKNCPALMRSGNHGVTVKSFEKAIDSSSGKVSAPKSSGKSSSSSSGSKWNSVGSKWTGQNLKINDHGGAVKDLQKIIGVKADSYFGKDTEEKLKKEQRKAGIAVDGIAGKDSYSKLKKSKKSSKSSGNKQKVMVKEIQLFIETKADGLDGPNTRKALLKKYQSELNKQFGAGLSVDGLWGPATNNAGVNVSKTARGNLTRIMQSALYLKGYTVVGKPDGINGKNTQKALKAFQKDNGLTVDGIAGKATFRAMFK